MMQSQGVPASQTHCALTSCCSPHLGQEIPPHMVLPVSIAPTTGTSSTIIAGLIE